MNKSLIRKRFFNFDSTGRPYRTNEATPYAPIQNASGKDWGEISFAQGFEASSNVGMVEMASRGISSEILEQYFDRFKLFQPTKLDNIKGLLAINCTIINRKN